MVKVPLQNSPTAAVLMGNIIIVAAPSGGGKTSLVKKLISNLTNIEISVSYTTRKIRPGEREAKDYFFINEQQFLQMITEQAFIEHARVFNHYYGTALTQITKRLQNGIDVILEIDWQGARQIKALFPTAIAIFIVPPSLEILKQRLLSRDQDPRKIIHHRMHRAQQELSHFAEFDYLIVNDNFDQAALELQAIVVANRLQIARQAVRQRQLLTLLLS